MLPDVSIVIPMFNSAAWIRETLGSVRDQTYPTEKLELLVLDDGSTDDSIDIARSFLRDHSMKGTVVQRDCNLGVSATRNQGWKLATSEWIQFLDSDDLLAPGKIEVQAREAVESPPDVGVVYSCWQHLDLRGELWEPSGPIVSPSVEDDTVVSILADTHLGYIGPTIVRRSVLEGVDGFGESLSLGEDFDLMMRIAMAGWRFRSAPADDPLFFYRRTPGSLWRRSSVSVGPTLSFVQALKTMELWLRERYGEHLPDRARSALAARYSKRLDRLFEGDYEAFRTTVQWIRDLGFNSPPGTPLRWQLVSRLVGYERMHALRPKYRRAVRRLRQLTGVRKRTSVSAP